MVNPYPFRQHQVKCAERLTESTEELLHMQQNFDAHLRTLTMQRSEKEDAKEKEESELEDLRVKERNLANRQGGLVAHRQVSNPIIGLHTGSADVGQDVRA